MGSCASQQHPSHPNALQKDRQKEVDNRIDRLLEDDRRVIKCLLLGAGECGKSTILKQMKILHADGFSEEEEKNFKTLVFKNTLESIQTLCDACRNLSIPLRPENTARAKRILEIPDHVAFKENPAHKDDVLQLWEDKGIQSAIQRSNEFYLLDSASYFLDPPVLERIFHPDFKPQHQDILRCRLATTGIIQTDFIIDKLRFKMYDVGGQRGERKKWIHSFDNVTAIMFIASLSEYDLVLAEDRARNRLRESLDLFEGIINLPWFKDAPIILFLNKNDLFIRKIKTVDIGIYFPVYTGGCDYEAGLKFIQDNYFDRNQNPHKTIYCHVTDATNTQNIAFVWKSTKHIILEQNLTRSGLLMC